LGSETKILINQNQTAGLYSVNWDGKDNHGQQTPNGICANLRLHNTQSNI
jgi:flagellar hook assembly protein FlgD